MVLNVTSHGARLLSKRVLKTSNIIAFVVILLGLIEIVGFAPYILAN